ncbi:MAG: hypothetical protein HUU02_00505 [Bacteroidetes bacterium]|nr:hypothetical protein [Bacteroidota bacterium]
MKYQSTLILLFIVLLSLLHNGCYSPQTKRSVFIYKGMDYTAFCADSVRVYLSNWFDSTILHSGTDSCNGYSGVSFTDPELTNLLTSGELTGEMFCKAIEKQTGEYPRPQFDSYLGDSYHDSLNSDLNWHGGLIVVVQWLNRCTINGDRQTTLCVSMNRFEVGGDCMLFSFTIKDDKIRDFKYKGYIL